MANPLLDREALEILGRFRRSQENLPLISTETSEVLEFLKYLKRGRNFSNPRALESIEPAGAFKLHE